MPSGRALPARPALPRPRKRPNWLLWGIVTPLVGLPVIAVVTLALVMLGMLVLFGGRVYPRVAVGGVVLGGLSEAQASAALREGWTTLILRDGARSWSVPASELGITLDAPASAARAYAEGRSRGMWLSGVATAVNLAPVVSVDSARAETALRALADRFAQPAANAGLRIVNGQVQPTPPREGRELDLRATLHRLTAPGALDGGELQLAMLPVAPTVTDASPLIAAAEQVLSQPLDVRLYDPVTGDNAHWTLAPEQWGAWLEVAPGEGPAGLVFTLNGGAAREYLASQASTALDPSRYLDVDEVVAALQAGLAAGAPRADARVYHHDRQHSVQAGETLISIAWDYGVPYPWIQQANGGIENVSIGQALTIPSPDNFMEFPVVPDKRIVLSISQQHAWVYENGQLKWDWVISTGIADSPTWPGIYQIISHVPNAYAANWNLYMPNFLGVYRPIPGADFTNGFHGFPTRGGSQLLWTNSLGTRVTYGCILLSNQNAQALYDWAENGVVVEIRP